MLGLAGRLRGRASRPRSLAVLLLTGLLFMFQLLPGCGESVLAPPDPLAEDYQPKIREIIYPTFGFPHLLEAGESFVLELDLTPGRADGQPDGLRQIQASIASTASNFPYRADLPVLSWSKGASLRWSPGAGRDQEEVLLVEVRVPEGVPPDLYDLQVEVRMAGKSILDRQLRALSVTLPGKSEYTFVHMTDLHVYDLSAPMGCMEGRGRGEALYLRKAIDQINLLRPDFVVITGDLVHGQMYLPEDWPPDPHRRGSSQYDYEYMWAYRELSRLKVPSFLVPGNHDGYHDGQKDGLRWWTETFGPLYYFQDLGNTRLLMLNSFDWEDDDRALSKGVYYGMVPILEPRRWKGQFRSGGDRHHETIAPPPDELGGQLAWFRDRLRQTPEEMLRLAFCHHDPFQEDCWSDDYFGGYRVGGGGEGRRSFMELCSFYRVRGVFSGHTHRDNMGSVPWKVGNGSTLYVNTTCAEPVAGGSLGYSGYRWGRISWGDVEDFVYSPPAWSWPFHAGVVPGEVVAEGDKEPALLLDLEVVGEKLAEGQVFKGKAANRLQRGFPALLVEFFVPAGAKLKVTVGEKEAAISFWPTSDPGTLRVRAEFSLPPGSELEVRVEAAR